MDELVGVLCLEVVVWLVYSGLVGCVTVYVLRVRKRRRHGKRYYVVSTSSSGEAGEVEMEDKSCNSNFISSHVTSCTSSTTNVEREEEEEEEEKREETTRKNRWRPKERKGSRKLLVSGRDSGNSGEIEEEKESDVSSKHSVIFTQRAANTPNERSQSKNIPTDSIPYDNDDESIPYVDADAEDDDDDVDDVDEGVVFASPPPPSKDVSVPSTSSNASSTPTLSAAKSVPPSVPSTTVKPKYSSLATLLRRHPRAKKNSTKVAKVLLFLFIGYILTVVTAIVIYRSSEFFLLYSDAYQCRNISYAGLAPDLDDSGRDQGNETYTEEEVKECLYYFNRSSGVDFEDVFIPVAVEETSTTAPIVHAWWIPAHRDGKFAAAKLTLLYTHGNADNISFFKSLYTFFAVELGINVFAWDYPGFGKSSGDASETAIGLAARGVFNHLLDERGVAVKDVVLWGYSLGGSVVADLASEYPNVSGVILQAPIDSTADVVSNFLPLTGWSLAGALTQKFETKTRIHSLSTCLLQFVGEEDETFGVAREKKLFRKAKSARKDCKTFFTINGLSHLEDPTEKAPFREKVVAFLEKIINRGILT